MYAGLLIHFASRLRTRRRRADRAASACMPTRPSLCCSFFTRHDSSTGLLAVLQRLLVMGGGRRMVADVRMPKGRACVLLRSRAMRVSIIGVLTHRPRAVGCRVRACFQRGMCRLLTLLFFEFSPGLLLGPREDASTRSTLRASTTATLARMPSGPSLCCRFFTRHGSLPGLLRRPRSDLPTTRLLNRLAHLRDTGRRVLRVRVRSASLSSRRRFFVTSLFAAVHLYAAKRHPRVPGRYVVRCRRCRMRLRCIRLVRHLARVVSLVRRLHLEMFVAITPGPCSAVIITSRRIRLARRIELLSRNAVCLRCWLMLTCGCRSRGDRTRLFAVLARIPVLVLCRLVCFATLPCVPSGPSLCCCFFARHDASVVHGDVDAGSVEPLIKRVRVAPEEVAERATPELVLDAKLLHLGPANLDLADLVHGEQFAV